MELKLKMVHFQLTRCCNLHCHFCGQKRTPDPRPMQTADWLRLLDELAPQARDTTVVLWGGEPTIAPNFETIATQAFQMGFHLQIITNGTRLEQWAPFLKEHFDEVFLSVDGPEPVHDSIRGKGVFNAIRQNLPCLTGGRARVSIMTVAAPESLAYLDQIPFGLPVDRAILHELIYLDDDEAAQLPPDVAAAWHANHTDVYKRDLAQTIERLKQTTFPVPVEFQPHGLEGFCREPYWHLHVGSGGETGFCTDFTHYTLGNVHDHSLYEIFLGEAAEQFRKIGRIVFCNHCAWKNTPLTILHFPCQNNVE